MRRFYEMKKILVALTIVLLHAGVFATGVRAQDVHLYLTEHELPNLVKCLPAPPDTIGEAFTHDIMRYMWGKTQRLDSVRLAQAKRDAVWNLDTTRVIYSEPFGYAIDPEKTPEIYRLFVNGVSTIEQIRFRPKAHYFRMRPYARFHESSIFPQDDAWLATEGSYRPVFLLNSCLDLFSAPRSHEVPLSRSYGVILPSSLTASLLSALVYSTQLPVSVCGTGGSRVG